jgi:hypothetical protein
VFLARAKPQIQIEENSMSALASYDAEQRMVFGATPYRDFVQMLSAEQRLALTRQPVVEPGADGRRSCRSRAADDFPVITCETGVYPIH